MSRPRLRLYTLGGTIAMAPDTGDGKGVVPVLDGTALLSAVPGLSARADIDVETVAQTGSANLGFADMIALAARIDRAAAEGVDGAIISQGTDTLAESAFVLNVIARPPIPVVLTGAMRHPAQLSADGAGNLHAAAIAACDARLGGRGAQIVMNDCLIAAGGARKAHCSRLDAFTRDAGAIAGTIVEDELHLAHLPEALPHIPHSELREPVPFVPLVEAVYDDEGLMLDCLPGDCRGLVIAAHGGGHLSEAMAGRAKALARRMPVLLASRTGAGHVLTRSYGYKGAEIDLIAGGLIPAGRWTPQQARLLLVLLLASGADRERIHAVFEQ
ncbi:MAG: asparaginase [Rhodothalassiaceae bacterium]